MTVTILDSEGYLRSVATRAYEFRRRLGWEENGTNKKAAVWQIKQEDARQRIAARSFGCCWASNSEGDSTDSEEDSSDSEEESDSSDSESECGSESSSDSASSSSVSDADLQLSSLVAKKRMSDSEWNKLLAFATYALRMSLMNLVIYKELCLHAYLGHVVEKLLVECGNIFVGRQPFGDPRANGVFELVGGLRTEMGRIRRLFLFVCIFSGKFLVASVF